MSEPTLTALTDPENVKFEIVPPEEIVGTGLTPEEASIVMAMPPESFEPEG